MRRALASSLLVACFVLGCIEAYVRIASDSSRPRSGHLTFWRPQHAEAAPEEDDQQSQHQRQLLQNPIGPAIGGDGRHGSMQDFVPDGYGLQQYDVYTTDGFVLDTYRIPHGMQRHTQPGKKPVVLLVHGFSLTSLSFAMFNPNESLSYILADSGFDVWFFNIRGADFSRGNVRYSQRQPEYWYSSMDPSIHIDLPETINFVLDKTGAQQLAVIGHSQGGTLVYGMLSSMPEMQSKVSLAIQMGPPVFMEYCRAAFVKNWALARNDLAFWHPYSYLGEFAASRYLWPMTKQCSGWPLTEFCAMLVYSMTYGPSPAIAQDDFVLLMNTWPGTISSRLISHWAQMISDGTLRLQHFDHGTDCSHLTRYNETCNQMRYGSMTPPEYDLGKIQTPMFIMQGSADIMVVEEDTAEQQRRLPNAHRLNYDGYTHMDYIWDRNARHAFDIVDLLFRYSAGT